MIANTTKMRKIQHQIKHMLETELFLCEYFNHTVERGLMTLEKLQELATIAGKPALHQDEIARLTKEEIMSNPYLKNINIPIVQIGNFKLSKRRIIRPGQITRFGEEKRSEKHLGEVNSYLVCDKTLRFPALVEGESKAAWMTVEPNEIKTFEGIIEQATGDVLLIGCGLGYLSYMLSLKEDVKSITIVDKNRDVLELFETHILPQFENKDKVQTIESDGLEYLRTADLSGYDHVSVDIWYDIYDMIYPYLRCLEIEKANPNVKFSYWQEGSLKATVQKAILTAITREDMVDGKENAFLSPLQKANIYAIHTIYSIIGEDTVRDTPLKTSEDIYNVVMIPNIRDFLFEWYANNLSTVEFQERIDIEKSSTIKGIINLGIDRLQQSKVYKLPPIKPE